MVTWLPSTEMWNPSVLPSSSSTGTPLFSSFLRTADVALSSSTSRMAALLSGAATALRPVTASMSDANICRAMPTTGSVFFCTL